MPTRGGGAAMLRDLRDEERPEAAETNSVAMKERSNEGNFIATEFPTKEYANENSSEVKGKGKKLSPKVPMKQSLKDAVLENGSEREEKVAKTRLNVDIEEDLHMWLKGHAIQNRRKLNDLIPRILKAYRDEVDGE